MAVLVAVLALEAGCADEPPAGYEERLNKAARDAAGLLPEAVRVHVALLTALHRLAPNSEPGVDELGFAARLTAADPDAAR
ncbi:hypothetical protein ACPCAE_31625 [Streptomyces cinereoruber]|uniref:hypothetical protein n=1 Tax=Streptomyces cinereoruber TaxID=67260 RepID=UPI003C2DDF35